MSEIIFFYQGVDFQLNNTEKFKDWINQITSFHNKICGELSFIFCTDNYLLQVNKKHLNHDYFTDIITFNYNQSRVISGDVFISIDRVKSNATQFSVSFEEELARVMIHGVLHLIGFNDKTEKEQEEMTKQENLALTKLS